MSNDNLTRAIVDKFSCKGKCEGCPLNKPVNEWEEHPTFCELLTEVDEKYTAVGFLRR